MPLNAGVLSFVLEPLVGLDIAGAAGATVSIVILTAAEAGDALPAASVALPVML